MEDVGIVYGGSVYFMAVWYNLSRPGKFCSNLEYFCPCWYVVPRKIWQPWLEQQHVFLASQL
jgi:hypothetical protein